MVFIFLIIFLNLNIFGFFGFPIFSSGIFHKIYMGKPKNFGRTGILVCHMEMFSDHMDWFLMILKLFGNVRKNHKIFIPDAYYHGYHQRVYPEIFSFQLSNSTDDFMSWVV